MSKKCPICGNDIPAENQKYCSAACKAEAQRLHKTCAVCGREMNSKNARYCSAQCRANAKKNKKACVVCGKKFWCPPSEEVICCGPVCSKIHRQKITSEREGNAELLKNARENFFEAHTGELHQSAKHYGLVTPTGDVIDITNLRHWVYTSGLFDNPATAYREFFRIIRTVDGKEKNPKKQLTHYCGYSIAYHDDGNLLNSKSATRHPRYCKVCGTLLPPKKRSYCGDDCARKAHAAIEKMRYHKKGTHND